MVRRWVRPATVHLLGLQVVVEDQNKSVAVVSDPGCLHQALAKGRLYEMKHR